MILLLASLSLCLYLGRGIQDYIALNALLSTANGSSSLYPILATACLLSVGAAMMAIEIISRSRHNRAMSREAQELGLAFSADTRPFEGSDVHGLPFLQGDASVEAANVMQATLDGRRALVLELPSCEGCEAETPHRHFTTVAAFRSPGIDIPEFEVGRKCTLSKLVDALFRKPAPVEDREFAKEFFVHCREPQKVHDCLTPAKLANLRPTAPAFHISANRDWVLIFRPGMQIPPEQFPEFLRETSKIASALLQ